MGIVHIQWQEVTSKWQMGFVILWLGLKYEVSLEKSRAHISGAEGGSCKGLLHDPLQGGCPSVCAQGQPPCPTSSQVPMGCVTDSIKTYKAEVLLVLPNPLHLRGVQDRLIIGHALLRIFLVLFLGIDSKNQDGEHHREMNPWDLK